MQTETLTSYSDDYSIFYDRNQGWKPIVVIDHYDRWEDQYENAANRT